MAQLEDAIEAKVDGTHSLVYWSMYHTCWIYNRYYFHTTMRVTPFQALHGYMADHTRARSQCLQAVLALTLSSRTTDLLGERVSGWAKTVQIMI